MSKLEQEELEHQIKLQEAIDRLYRNEDFKFVILGVYLKEECAKAIKDSTYPTKNSSLCIAKAQAAGYLEQFLKTNLDQAEHTKEELVTLRCTN